MRALGALRSRVIFVGTAALLLSGVVAALALSAASTARPVKSLEVRDANGRLVGPVDHVDAGGSATIVVIQVRGLPVPLAIERARLNGFGRTVQETLMFESTDCTGQPFITSPPIPNEFFPHAVLNTMRIWMHTTGME